MIDCVIPLGNGSQQNDFEVKYCIRSLVKNLHGLRNVIIVGNKPEWLSDEAIFIPAEDSLTANKDGNLIKKVLLACELESLSDNFIRLSDDQILLQPMNESDFILRHSGSLESFPEDPKTRWRRRMIKTREILKSYGFTIFNFDTHAPSLYNKQEFIRIMRGYDHQNDIGYCVNTLYFNSLTNISKDARVEAMKVHFERVQELTQEQIITELTGKTFLGYNDKGFSLSLKEVIMNIFPEKSKFEQ